ncbi:MAG: chorismate synthase [Treponematales bacterium]
MSGNVFGSLFRVVTFGESHGAAVGCVIDGCPAGLALEREDIARELRRRRPGGGGASTERAEADEPEILSGVFEGRTLGTPIAVVIRNEGQRGGDYEGLREVYRPGHADWTWEAKFGVRDFRGGGRASGRETAGRVAAGAVAKVFLAGLGIRTLAWTSEAAGLRFPGYGEDGFDEAAIESGPLRVPSVRLAEEAARALERLKGEGDSAGGVVSCRVTGLPPGLGAPVFGKLTALLGQAVLSIGGCKGVEFGAGFAAAALRGSENNDIPVPAGGGGGEGLPEGAPLLAFRSNRAGGSLGGISTGQCLEFRAAFKPAASIARTQETVDRRGRVREISVRGRHDVCVVPRAVPVVEAVTALVLADLALLRRADRV